MPPIVGYFMPFLFAVTLPSKDIYKPIKRTSNKSATQTNCCKVHELVLGLPDPIIRDQLLRKTTFGRSGKIPAV